MKDRYKGVPASYLFLIKEGKILLALRQNTGYQDDKWNLPSGHIEYGELPREAMVREAKEEVGVDIQVEDLKFAHTMYRVQHDPTGARIDYFFSCEKWEGEPMNGEPDKCGGVEWFPLDALPENTTPHVRHAIQSWRAGEAFSEMNAAWLKERGLWFLD